METSNNDAIYNILVNSSNGSKETFRQLFSNMLDSIYSRTDDPYIIQEFQSRMMSRAKKYVESQGWDMHDIFSTYTVISVENTKEDLN